MIEVHRLSYTYPTGQPALHEVSFTVAAGERVALVGANGAGKSTLLLHLNGILTGDGTVKIMGLEPRGRLLPRVRRLVGLVFQQPDDQLFHPTLAGDVAFGPRNYGLTASEVDRRVRDGLAAVGLAGFEQRSPFQLSVGEKKRAALATALALDAPLLVLDEPTSNLDPRGRRQLAELLMGMGRTQLIATHDLALAQALCDRALLLSSGRLAADTTPGALAADAPLLAAHGLA